MNWPEQAAVVRVTAKNATGIRKAFDASMNGDAITASWFETHPAGGSVSPQMARDWALAQVQVNKKPLDAALSRMYADGYVLGEKVAKTRLMSLVVKSVTPGVVDWSRWVPGMASAAALVKPTGGLKELMRTRKVSITNDIVHTKLDRIGTALSASLERGLGARETAKAINAIINDPQHALTIARTEMNRSMSVATRETYEKNNVEKVEWLVAEGCEDCQENADASPIGINETFPTGDVEPPAHPNCMCAIAPVFDDSDLPEADEVPAEGFDIGTAEEGDLLTEVQPEEPMVDIPQEAPVEPEFPSSLNEEVLLSIVKDTPEIGMNNEDLWLEAIQDKMGYGRLPTLIETADEFRTLAANGDWISVRRGISNAGKRDKEFAKKAAEEFKTGKNYAGQGIYGNGTYTTTSIETAKRYAKDGNRGGGWILNILIPKTAKIIDSVELSNMVGENLQAMATAKGYADARTFMRMDYDAYKMFSDLGRYAASKGYDAISVKQGLSETYYVVLNRSKVAVLK